MKSKISTKISFLLFILFKNCFLIDMYFKITFNCGNDYPDYITSSEGSIEPNNPFKDLKPDNTKYIFYFNIIKHNIAKELCIKWVNLKAWGEFAFESFFVNEYDFSKVKYEDFFSCKNCNLNEEKGFYTTLQKCNDNNFYINLTSIPGEFDFCLNPIKDPTIFYIDNTKINQKYYKGNTFKYIINNETEKIYIDKIFNINGQEDLEFNLEAVSLVITNIVNKKGNIFNDDEELKKMMKMKVI